ncbi:exosortase A [Rhodocyclaceae bacterium SMB388]
MSTTNQTPSNGFAIVSASLLAVFVWLVAWYWPTASQIAGIWERSDTYAHGMVVIPVFIWLVWRKRHAIGGLTPQPVAWMAIPVAMMGSAWLLGSMVNVDGLTHFALVSMVVLGFAGMLGWRLARILLFPLLFLFFGLPIGDFLLPTLMHYTAEFTVFALRASGVPVYQEGLFFIVPNGRWSVVEACSGIRYLIASLMVGSLYAYLNYRSTGRRLLFMVVALVVPIIANWVRAYFIVMLGYLTDNRLAAGVDHILYGWVFFGIVILLMFWIGSRWREDEVVQSVATPGHPMAALSKVQALPVVAIFAASAMFPLALSHLDRPVVPFSVELASLQPAGGWALEGDILDYRPAFSGHRGELLQTFRHADGGIVGLYVAYYADQREGSELVAWGNRLANRGQFADWQLYAEGRDALDAGTVRRGLLRSGNARIGVWHWYWSNGRTVSSDMLAKIILAADRLTGRPDDAAMIAVFSPVHDQPDDVRPLIQRFLGDHRDQLESMLQGVEVGR